MSWDLYSEISLHSFGDSDFYVNAKMLRRLCEQPGNFVSWNDLGFVKNIVESSGEGYACHTLDIENIESSG